MIKGNFIVCSSKGPFWIKICHDIYLFISRIPTPATAGLARINAKEREKKERKCRRAEKERDRGTEGETSHPTPSSWLALRGRRTEWKTEERKREKHGADPQPIYPGPFGRFLRPAGITMWASSFNPPCLQKGGVQ